MSLYEIVFKLNELERIVIELDDISVMMDCCCEVPLLFFKGLEKIQIDLDSVRSYMRGLISSLTQALDNQLIPHESIAHDWGLLYAHYSFYCFDRAISKRLGIVLDVKNNWIGNKHLLFAYDIAVWVYNDVSGAIKLDFTPWYSGNYFDFEGETDFTQYDQFLKDYKPLFTRTIPREIAQQWLDQANSILKQIADNSERLEKEEQEELE
jgi:hypothetical protein